MSDLAEAAYLDPEIAAILREAVELPDRTELPVTVARVQMAESSRVWNTPLPEMAQVNDFTVPGPDGAIPVRLFRPSADADRPVVIYLHGGGFAMGSLETHHRLMRGLALASDSAVLGVDYRLAPEAPFPAALDDCLAVIRWLRTDGAGLEVDTKRLILAGDSAGANLALACLLVLRDAGEPLPAGAALFYGCYWSRLDTLSHEQFGGGAYRLSTNEMAWFWGHYLGGTRPGDPLAEPLHAKLEHLPPLFLNFGTVDPLADDTRTLTQRLAAAGVAHEWKEYPGLVHGFLQMTARCAAARQALVDAGDVIRRFGRGP